MKVVYFSSGSGNTRRFVEKLECETVRIPIRQSEVSPLIFEPFVLITPCYADGVGRGSVPKQVVSWLNNPENRKHIIGVIGAGNRNFGPYFAQAADVISAKCMVPMLYKFELSGNDDDVDRVQTGLRKFFNSVGQ